MRRKYGLAPHAPLHAEQLAGELKVEIVSPSDLDLAKDCCHRLLTKHAEFWSAITIPGTPALIVYNPSHSAARQNSDLMHELSHLLLDHQPGMTFIDPATGMAVRTHETSQEEEAGWLAGCLLLPREALLRIKRMRIPEENACNEYLVSMPMLRFRMNLSGVNIQHRRSR